VKLYQNNQTNGGQHVKKSSLGGFLTAVQGNVFFPLIDTYIFRINLLPAGKEQESKYHQDSHTG